MTPYGSGTTGITWSTCSTTRYHNRLIGLGDGNCLAYTVRKTTLWNFSNEVLYGIQLLLHLFNRISFCFYNCERAKVLQANPTRSDATPGQDTPYDLQCMAVMGSCGRAYPTELEKCNEFLCTNNNGASVTGFLFSKLDGSYCGAGKVAWKLKMAAPKSRKPSVFSEDFFIS